MRWTICTVAFFLSFVGASGTLCSEERGEVASKPKQQCIVFCRWFDDTNNSFTSGMHSLDNGENVCIHPSSPSIDIAVSGIKQSDGVTVDVTVEPAADSRKIQVVKFVKFNETLVIPLGDKRANGAMPRVEILIGAGDIIHWNWTRQTNASRLDPEGAERQAIFDAIGATGYARILCTSGSRLAVLMGEEAYGMLWDRIDCVRDYSGFAIYLYGYYPHRVGLANALAAVCPVLNEWFYMRRDEYERAVFGSVGCYTVELIDGPALMQNIETLNRLPERSRVAVVINTRKPDERLLQAIDKLHIRNVHVSDVAVDYFWSECEGHADLKSPSHNDRIKMVTVNWQLAERAIPDFQKLPNLEEILIFSAYGHESKAQESLEAVQKALPNTEAHLVFFGEKKEPKEPPQKITAHSDAMEDDQSILDSVSVW